MIYALSTVGWMLSGAVLAVSLGYFAVTLPRQMQIPRAARFAVGVAITPQVIAVWVILVTTLIPGAPKAVLAFGPGVVAALYLLWIAPRLWRRVIVTAWRILSKQRVALVATLSGVVVFLSIMQPVSFRITQPIAGADVSLYLNEAKELARTGDFRDYIGFEGTKDGSAQATLHGPSFAAYLASPLAANALATGVVGPRQDLATRIALVTTFLLLLAAIYALALSVFRSWLTPILTISIFLTTANLSYILVASSRDGFRLAPMVCLLALLAGQLRRASIHRHPASAGGLLAFFAASVVGGHSLALIELPVMITAWILAWMGRFRKNFLTIGLVLCAIGAGAFVGGGNHVATYLRTGSIMGDNALSGSAFSGTVYARNMKTVSDPRVGGDTSYFGLVTRIFSRDPLQLLLGTSLAFLSIALFVFNLVRRRESWENRTRSFVFVSAATVGMAMLYLTVGQVAGMNLTYFAAANFRYVFLWNLLASLMIGVLITRALTLGTLSPKPSGSGALAIRRHG